MSWVNQICFKMSSRRLSVDHQNKRTTKGLYGAGADLLVVGTAFEQQIKSL